MLEEHAELRRRMAARAGEAGLPNVSKGFQKSAIDSQRQAAGIRALLFTRNTPEPVRDGEKKARATARTATTRRPVARTPKTVRKRPRA